MSEITITQYWKEGFAKIFKYSGRASQKEFLAIFLLNIIVGIAARIISFPFERSGEIESTPLNILFLLLGILGIVLFLMKISAEVRRLHDLGLSGFWLLLAYLLMIFGSLLGAMLESKGLFAFVGGAGVLLLIGLLLISCFMPTGKKDNKYGPSLRKTW